LHLALRIEAHWDDNCIMIMPLAVAFSLRVPFFFTETRHET